MRRTGIDLSTTTCALVDIERRGRRRTRQAADLRVHHYRLLGHGGSAATLQAELTALLARGEFPRRACVNLWGLRSSHHYLLLPESTADLAAVARAHAAVALRADERELTVSIHYGSTRILDGQVRREAWCFAAPTRDIERQLRPIVEAGFAVEALTTPCGALWSQARLRRATSQDEVCAYVALGPAQTSIAIFAGGALLYGRDVPWGHMVYPAGAATPDGREALATRLASEIRQSDLYVRQIWDDDVSQVLLCGDMPELRSLTAPLIERLNVEVEMLDTLEGLDVATLPAGLSDDVAAFRLATAVAADPPPLDLLPPREPLRFSPWALRTAAAGVAAAIAVAAFFHARAEVIETAASREAAGLHRVRDDHQGMTDAPNAARTAALLESIMRTAPSSVRIQGVRVTPAGNRIRVTIDATVPEASGNDGRQRAYTWLKGLEDAHASYVDMTASLRTVP